MRRSVYKDAFQGTVLYSIPIVGQRIASILLLSVVTRVLTRDDFGMLSLLDQVGSVLTILLGGSFSASLGYFYFQDTSEKARAKVVGTTVLGAFLLGSAAGLIGWLAMGAIARGVFLSMAAMLYLPLVFLKMPFDFAGEALFGWLRVEDRQAAFAKISLVRIGLTLVGVGILVGVLKFHLMAYMSTNLAAQIVTFGILGACMFRNLRPAVSAELFRRMVRFSLPMGLSLIAMFVINFGDQFVLRQYRSLAEVGIYALAYRIGMLVAVAYSSFSTYWTSQIYAIMQREDAEDVFARLFTYAVLLASSVTLAVILASVPGMRILVAKDFQDATPLIPIIAAANGIRVIGEFLRFRFLAAGKPGYKAYCDWTGMAVCAALYFLLIPRYGMWGGAAATIITFVVLGVISVVATYRMNPYRVEGRRLLKLGGVIATITILYYAVPVSSLFLQTGWAALLLALFPTGLWALRFFTADELHAIRGGIQKITHWRYSAVDA